MTNQRIKQVVDFLYSSNTAKKVPFRICLSCGMGGFDINKAQCAELLQILSTSINIKKDCAKFRGSLE